eukprot:jgi/Ulvmu1/4459/UM002_0184.1
MSIPPERMTEGLMALMTNQHWRCQRFVCVHSIPRHVPCIGLRATGGDQPPHRFCLQKPWKTEVHLDCIRHSRNRGVSTHAVYLRSSCKVAYRCTRLFPGARCTWPAWQSSPGQVSPTLLYIRTSHSSLETIAMSPALESHAIENASNAEPIKSTPATVEVNLKQVQELVTRLTAVRGALQDHLEDNPLVFEGVAAVLHFVSQICKKLKETILGEGSGPLQELLVQEVGSRLHEVDIAKHFTPTSFENKIKQMNGYQSHIVSPEIALRALIADAFADVAPIAQWMVLAVRTFLSQQAKEAAAGVVEDDPDHRQQLADLIVQGVDEVLEDWEKDAASMTCVIMDMEKAMVSPVFFQRLALKRKQRDLAMNAAPTGKFRGAADRVMSSGAGLLARLKGKKGATKNGESEPPAQGGGRRLAPGMLRRRGTHQEDGGDEEEQGDDAEEGESSARGTSRPSFAQNARSSAPGGSGAAFQPGPARNLRFVSHIKSWDSVSAVVLREAATQSQFTLVRGKCFKRARATGFQKAVTKSWSGRHFIFDCGRCDMFYWKEQPTAAFIEAAADAEHHKATRVVMTRAKIAEPTAEDMKGFSGPETAGLRIENAYVKSKFDTVIVGFASASDKAKFVKIVAVELQKASAEPEPRSVREEEQQADNEHDGEGDHDHGEEEAQHQDGEEEAEAAHEEGERDKYDGEIPDSPTGGYQIGGLGVGSHFFNAEDLKDSSGTRVISSDIVVPSRFRSLSRSADGEADQGDVARVEGSDALQWLTSDMNMYVTIVKDTVAATLPKVAVMMLLERIITNELQRRLQRMALQWGQATIEGAASVPARMMDGRDATTQAIKDLEDAMNDVRMAGISVTAACMRDQSKLAEARCPVSTQTLALAGHARILAAAQQPSPASILEDMYGPLFPFSALDASDSAVQRVEAAAEAERSRNIMPPSQGGDPLAVAHVLLQDQSGARANGDPQRSGSVSSAISGIAGRMRLSGRRKSGAAADEGEEDEDPGELGGLGGPVRPQRSSQQPAPAAAAAASVVESDDALATPARHPPAPAAGADPLADPLSGSGLSPGLGFGTDPLSAPRAAAARTPPPPNGHDEGEEEVEEEPAAPIPRQQPSGAPLRAPPRAPPPRAAPPRRAPPGPGVGAPRTAPPAPGIGGRPAPLRAAPGRPAPGQARPAPMRPSAGRDNLPL